MKSAYTKRHMLALILLTIVVSVLTTAVLIYTVDPPVVRAQQAGGPFDGLTLYATSIRETDKEASFIFVNSRTGDIWVYRNKDLKEHYRITEVGKKLEDVKD